MSVSCALSLILVTPCSITRDFSSAKCLAANFERVEGADLRRAESKHRCGCLVLLHRGCLRGLCRCQLLRLLLHDELLLLQLLLLKLLLLKLLQLLLLCQLRLQGLGCLWLLHLRDEASRSNARRRSEPRQSDHRLTRQWQC